jgi:hypothetical protein
MLQSTLFRVFLQPKKKSLARANILPYFSSNPLEERPMKCFLKCSLASFALVSFASTSLAQGTAADLGGSLTLSGNVSQQSRFTGDKDTLFGIANIKLTAELSENVKAVLMMRVRQDLTSKGVSPQTVEQMLSEAYIKIDKVGGKPVAFIFGKQTIPFGNMQTKDPNYEFNPINAANYQRDVIGFTVQLEDVAFFDLVEASVFETKAKDLKIGDVDGAALRVTKDVTDKWKVIASGMHKGNGAAHDDNRGTVGFLFKDGNWTVWSEGVYMDGNSTYPNAHWAAVAGAEYKIDKKQRIVVESSYIADCLTRISAAYEIQVFENFYVAPEVAYVLKPDGSGEWQAMIRTDLRFATK